MKDFDYEDANCQNDEGLGVERYVYELLIWLLFNGCAFARLVDQANDLKPELTLLVLEESCDVLAHQNKHTVGSLQIPTQNFRLFIMQEKLIGEN